MVVVCDGFLVHYFMECWHFLLYFCFSLIHTIKSQIFYRILKQATKTKYRFVLRLLLSLLLPPLLLLLLLFSLMNSNVQLACNEHVNKIKCMHVFVMSIYLEILHPRWDGRIKMNQMLFECKECKKKRLKFIIFTLIAVSVRLFKIFQIDKGRMFDNHPITSHLFIEVSSWKLDFQQFIFVTNQSNSFRMSYELKEKKQEEFSQNCNAFWKLTYQPDESWFVIDSKCHFSVIIFLIDMMKFLTLST